MKEKQLCNETRTLMKVIPDISYKVEIVIDAFKESSQLRLQQGNLL
jgi:hypothetical protein